MATAEHGTRTTSIAKSRSVVPTSESHTARQQPQLTLSSRNFDAFEQSLEEDEPSAGLTALLKAHQRSER